MNAHFTAKIAQSYEFTAYAPHDLSGPPPTESVRALKKNYDSILTKLEESVSIIDSIMSIRKS